MILATAIKPSVERETLQLSGADTVRSPERLALHHEEEGLRQRVEREAFSRASPTATCSLA
jgi:hypothetical protein